MTLATNFLTDFVEGWAQFLEDAGIGLTWDPTGANYNPANTNIWLMQFSTLTTFDNSKAVCLTPYPLTDDPTFADSTIGLQVKVRGIANQDPRMFVWPTDDKIANALLGNFPLDLANGVHVSTILGRTSSSLGYDAKNRLTWQSSYPCRVLRPGAHRN